MYDNAAFGRHAVHNESTCYATLRRRLLSGVSLAGTALAAAAIVVSVDFGLVDNAQAASNTTISVSPGSENLVLNGNGSTASNDPNNGDYFDVGNVTIESGVIVQPTDTSTSGVLFRNFNGGYGHAAVNNGSITVSGYYAYGVRFRRSGDSIAIAEGGSFTNAALPDSNNEDDGKIFVNFSTDKNVGILASGDVDGTITNSSTGVIRVHALSASAGGTGIGIFVDGTLSATGSVENAGTISVGKVNPGSWTGEWVADGVYYGVSVSSLAGNISNSGQIEINIENAKSATAVGIFVDGNMDATGSITNSGTIDINMTAPAFGSPSSISAAGIWVDGSVSGSITNTATGTIDVRLSRATPLTESAGGYSSAALFGISANSVTSTGVITNAGAINVSVDDFSEYYATAIGIYVESTMAGAIENSGSIAVAASAVGATQYLYTFAGVYVGNVAASGAVTNASSGTILVSLDYSASTPEFVGGIYVAGANAGTITNAGSINISSIARVNDIEGAYPSLVEAHGVAVDGNSASLVNSGAIGVSAINDYASKSAVAYGLWISETATGSLVNSSGGRITVQSIANGESATATAYGISASSIEAGANFANAGEINVDAYAPAGVANAYGVKVDGIVGASFTNTGDIRATINEQLSANAYSIAFAMSEPDLTLIQIAPNANVVNSAGALLSGNLYLSGGAGLSNAGTISLPENANSDLAAYVSGDYSQVASGVLVVKVYGADPDQHSQLKVGGTVALDGEIYVDVRQGGPLAIGQTVEDVVITTTAGGISGNFSRVADNSALFNFISLIDGDTVDLVVEEGRTVTDAVKAVGLRPALGAARVIDELIDENSVPMAGLISALGSLATDKEVADAVYQTLPLLTGGAARLVRDTVVTTTGVIDDRMTGLSGGLSSVTGVNRNFWITGVGTWNHQDEMDKSSGYNSSLYGVVAGIDGEITSNYSIGAAFAYVNTQADSDSDIINDTASLNSYQGIIYGLYEFNGSSLLRYQLDAGRHMTEGRRHMAFGEGDAALNETAKSDYGNTSVHAGVSVEHSFALSDSTTFTPRIRGDYISVWSESYDETGAGPLNLAVDSELYQTLVLAVDANLEHALSDAVRLQVNAGAGYDVMNQRSEVTAAYAGAPDLSFNVSGMQTGPWLGNAGVTLAYQPAENIELKAGYDLLLRDNFIGNAVALDASWKF